jgi:hypothetical protein
MRLGLLSHHAAIGFRGAGVPPVISVIAARRKTAGETPAPQKPRAKPRLNELRI